MVYVSPCKKSTEECRAPRAPSCPLTFQTQPHRSHGTLPVRSRRRLNKKHTSPWQCVKNWQCIVQVWWTGGFHTHCKVEAKVSIRRGVEVGGAHSPPALPVEHERRAWLNLSTLVAVDSSFYVPASGKNTDRKSLFLASKTCFSGKNVCVKTQYIYFGNWMVLGIWEASIPTA